MTRVVVSFRRLKIKFSDICRILQRGRDSCPLVGVRADKLTIYFKDEYLKLGNNASKIFIAFPQQKNLILSGKHSTKLLVKRVQRMQLSGRAIDH